MASRRPRTRSTTAIDPPIIALEEMLGQVKSSIKPIGEPSDDELKIINAHALAPLDKNSVFVYASEVSNNLRDSYQTVMDEGTTLKNYVRDFEDGLSLQSSHNTKELGMGRTFQGWLEERGKAGDPKNPKRTAAMAKTYIPRGIRLPNGQTTDDVIRGIETGIYKDESIHFADGQYFCSVCNSDMLRNQSCNHLPGLEYRVKGVPTLAYARIKNARAVEKSLVFDGSTPKAMVNKAQDLASRGILTDAQVRIFEDMSGCRINRAPAVVAPPLPTAPDLQNATSSKVCPSCAMALVNGVCGACGYGRAAVPSSRGVCPSCGMVIDQTATVCPNCGKNIGPPGTKPEDVVPTEPPPDGYAQADGEHRGELETDHYRSLSLDLWFRATVLEERARAATPKYYLGSADDPSYPINNCGDVQDAASLVGNSKTFSYDTVKAHVTKAADALGCDIPDAWQSQTKSTGGSMDPLLFVSVITAPMPIEDKERIFDQILPTVKEEELTPDVVRAVFTEVVKRVGKTISADTASKIQGAIDTISASGSAYDNAVKALKTLVSMGGMDPGSAPPEQTKKKDDNPDSSTGKKGVIGTNPNSPTHGVIDRGTGDGQTRASCPSCGAMNDTSTTKCSTCSAPMTVNGATGVGSGRAPAQGGTGNDQGSPSIPGNVKNQLVTMMGILQKLLTQDQEQNAGNAQQQPQGANKGKAGSDTFKGGGPAPNGKAPIASTAANQVTPPGRAEIEQELQRPEFLQLRQFIGLARDGQRYRRTLETELLEWGVRAKGKDFNRELYERIAPNCSVEDLEVMTRDFEGEAYARFKNAAPGDVPEWAKRELSAATASRVGRQTQPSEPYAPPSSASAPVGVGGPSRSSLEQYRDLPKKP